MLTSVFVGDVKAQCDTWNGKPDMEHLTELHSIYRTDLKGNNFNGAYENWKILYDKVPAADGRRDFHFTDGITILTEKWKGETDATKKSEWAKQILAIYDGVAACVEAKGISYSSVKTEANRKEKVGYFYGRKAFDMFYTFQSDYVETKAAIDKSYEYSDKNIEYITLAPWATMTVYLFQKEKVSKEEALRVYNIINELESYHAANKTPYSAYYTQAKEASEGEFAKIENQIFDCAYFHTKYKEEYTTDKDPLRAKERLSKLLGRGCDENDPFLVELKSNYETYAKAENAKIMAEYEANNPAAAGKRFYEDGKYSDAIEKFRQAIDKETDNSKKSDYYMFIAGIQHRNLNSYSAAKSSALKAAELDPGSGEPYNLIGDLYAKTANSCGDSWGNSLAILAAYDKYVTASNKRMSADQEAKVRSKITRYRSYFPDKEQGFMQGYKAGSTQRVPCWIGETVAIRYK